MSVLIMRWLNVELKLHQKVKVLEKDASNGYLIAEVLHRYDRELQLESYQDSSSLAAKIHNMELLGEKFKALGFPFPVNTRRAIMMEDRSVVLQVFLQLKEFLDQRLDSSPKRAKGKGICVEQSTKGIPRENFPLRDMEKRFIEEAADKFHPKNIRFHKGIDMAVHLRKFKQAKWQAETEHHKWQQQVKADKNAASAKEYAIARSRSKEKADFRRRWDQNHIGKWRQTRRHFLAAKVDDMRFEINSKARRQMQTKAKLIESEKDAAVGLMDFQRNLERLPISSGVTELTLRPIPMNEADAVAHFRDLEERVQVLSFRPSNNMKLMKELRKRRKEQQAAEKDRRMRRSKALTDEKKLVEVDRPEKLLFETYPNQGNAAALILEPENSDADKTNNKKRERYLESKRAELEDNLTRLREFGSEKREKDMKVLQQLRATKRRKEHLQAWSVCSDAVDRLITLALENVSSSNVDLFNAKLLKKEQLPIIPPPTPTSNHQGGVESCHELDVTVVNFLSCSNTWATLPLQSKLSTYDVNFDIENLIKVWANSTVSLDTSWQRPSSFVLLCLFTEDNSGMELARRASLEHHLAFLQFESIVNECVKLSYDPHTLRDQVTVLSDRERELGALGLKVADFRQKNTPLSDALAVEIMATAVSLCRREAILPQLEDTVQIQPNGCILHNFPRTVDEAKLLKKVLLENFPKKDNGSTGAVNSEKITDLTLKSVVPTTVSEWDCVISISPDQNSVMDEAEVDKTKQGSDSLSGLVDKPTLSLSHVLSAENQLKLAFDEEQRVRKEEQKANFKAYWSQTTRYIQIQRVELHRDVVTEIIHLCIDIYARASHVTIPEIIECGIDYLPQQLNEKRIRRRESMNFTDRIMWLKASKEIELEDDAFRNLSEKLHKLKESLIQKIREPMSTTRSALRDISTQTDFAIKALETKLFSNTHSFQNRLNQASADLKAASSPSKLRLRERIFTELEVSLGDMADIYRKTGNNFVHAFAQKSFPDIIRAVDIVYQSLPLICYYLKDFVQQKMEILRTQLYDHIPFLGVNQKETCYCAALSEKLLQEAMDSAINLGGKQTDSDEVARVAGKEIMALLTHVASEYSFNFIDEALSVQYPLSEINVVSMDISRLLQQVTLLCRYADRLRQTARQLYAITVRRLQHIVSEDIHKKDKSITEAMENIRAHGHATWTTQGLELSSSSRIANRLPYAQNRCFLTTDQLHALINAFIKWEISESTVSKTFGGSAIANDVFVALILKAAAKTAFPKRWKDPNAVAAVTQQQSNSYKAVSWKKFLWSLLCIQFTDLPSLENILAYQQRALNLPAVMHRYRVGTDPIDPRSIYISHADFRHLPLWFEEFINRNDAVKLKELVFHLFATGFSPDDSNKTDEIALLPMLLCWCVHPSCSFSVHHELTVFAPDYSRGLFRVFHVLQTFYPTSSCISPLSAISEAFKSPPSLESFASFVRDCPTDLHCLYLLQNPFETLVQLF